MFSALLRKECRQARTLTLVGAALGLLLPLILYLFAGEEGDQRLLRAYTTRDVFFTLSPGLMALGLWPFWALMSGVQSFAGDLSDGTERFLLDRPVSRSKGWFARLLAALGSVLVVVGASLLGWLLFSTVLGGYPFGEITQGLVDSLTVGLIASLIVFSLCGGILAASFGARSFAGVLLGAVLGAIFPAALYKIVGFYHFFAVGLAVAGCLILPLMLLAVSWMMLCRGEPAGRGRWVRGVGVLASASVILAVAVLVLMSWILRSASYELTAFPYVRHSSSYGDTAFFHSRNVNSAGWLIDPVSGKRLRFFPPIVTVFAFAPDGKRLAVVTDGGAFGTHRIDLLHTDGSIAAESVKLPESIFTTQTLFWREQQLFWTGAEGTIYEVDFAKGEARERLSLAEKRPRLARSFDSKTIYLVRELAGETSENLGFFPVDLDVPSLAQEPTAVTTGRPWNSSIKISPSARFSVVTRAAVDDSRQSSSSVLDLVTGDETTLFTGVPYWRWVWLAGDRLAWIEKSLDPATTDVKQQSLRLWEQGQPQRTVRTWNSDNHLPIVAEPGGDRLLINEFRLQGAGPWPLVELSIFDPRTDRWQALPTSCNGLPIERAAWAGQGRLLVSAGEKTYLLDPDNPEEFIPL